MPRKAERNSWGCNEPAGRGKRRLRFWADMRDGKGYRRCSKTIRGTKRDGDDELRRLWQEHAKDAPQSTLSRIYARWWLPDALARVSDGDLSPDTLALYQTAWRRHIEPYFGSQSLADIKAFDVQEWLLSLTKWNAAVSKSLASSIAEMAITLEIAERNPFSRKYRMPKAADGRTKAIWTLAQIGEAADALRGTILEVPVIMCGLGSCRVGEGCAPKLSEIEFSTEHGMTVMRSPVSHQLKRSGELTDKLKNPQSRRTVCIPEPWSLRLREIADEKRAQGCIWLNDDGTGHPVKRTRLKSAWDRAERNELATLPRTTMQNLRSSWETFMRWELGVDGDMVDSMMGHAGKNIRTRHYDRPLPDVYAETCALAHLGAFKVSRLLDARDDEGQIRL